MDFRTAAVRGLACLGVVLLAAGCAAHPPPDASSMAGGGLEAHFRKHGGSRTLRSGGIEIHDRGPAIKAEMLELACGAQDHILVSSFLLTEGPETREIFEALAERRRAGVKVHVMGDGSSRFVSEPHAFDALTEAGLSWAEFKPVNWRTLLLAPLLLERDHRKYWIVDGRSLYLGGANVNDPSLAPPESGANLELMVRLDSPKAARELTESFVETWNEARGTPPLSVADFAEARSGAGGGAAEFWLFNQDFAEGREDMTRGVFDGMFASARDSVWLLQPYTFVNPHVLSRVREMSGRGVEVHVVLSHQVRAPRFHYASHYGILGLLDAGARVWVYDSETSPLHHKAVLVDDSLAYVGSANLNFRSYRLSRELGAVFDDPAAVAGVRRAVEEVMGRCVEVDREEARRYRSPRYFTWWALMQVAG